MKFDNIIIISKEKLELLFSKKKSTPYIWTILSILGTLVMTYFTTENFKPVLGVTSNDIETIILTLIFVFSIVFLAIGVRIIIYMYQKRTYSMEQLKDSIIESSLIEPVDNTLIFLFCKMDDNEIKFAVKNMEKWGNSYFCPYLNDDKPNEDFEIKEDSIKERVKENFLGASHISINMSHLFKLSSIKLSTDNIPREFIFRFIIVSAHAPFFTNFIYDKIIESKFVFKSIEELFQDNATLKFNHDILETIKANMSIIKKHIDEYNSKHSKIIWNIDKNCSKGCSICAYGDSILQKSTIEEKKQIVDSLNNAHINELDLATGDNIDINELQDIIKYIKQKLPSVSLSLTATSDVITKLTPKYIIKNRLNIDISYENPDLNDDGTSIRPRMFSENNLKVAKDLVLSNKIKVKAHVVISEQSAVSIKKIRNDLSTAKINDILLIRLMPVGRQKYETYPDALKHQSLYLKIKTAVSNNYSGIRFHCSLHGLMTNGSKNPCELGINKLGISPNGDVYACPWAEHIVAGNNPFKIGNILEERLDLLNLLITSKNYTKIQSQTNDNQPHCKVFAYYESSNMFSKQDVLYR